MQTLFSRVKRQATSVMTGDLELFKQNGQAYIKFIEDLTELFTEKDEKYGSIKVTKRDNDITRVNLKYQDSAKKGSPKFEIGFIYHNVSLYIVGFVTGSIFYVDKEFYYSHGKKIPSNWVKVIGTTKLETLEPFSYLNIMPDGEGATLNISNLDRSLQELTQVNDKTRRIAIMSEHLAPFVVAFSEAIRFPVVAKSVQDAIVKNRDHGTLKLDKNVVRERSLGHPDHRTEYHIFNIHSLLLNWRKLSVKVEDLYKNQNAACIEDSNYVLHLCKTQLNALLGVANSQAFKKFVPASTPGRSKRHLDSIYNIAVPQRPPLLEQRIVNHIDYEGNLGQTPPHPSSSSSGILHSTVRPDLVGALHLLTVGLLYAYGQKMNMTIESRQSYRNPQEAYGIAVDLVDRIACVLKSAGLAMEIDFEEQMWLQRELSGALIRGQGVAQVLTRFLEGKYLSEKDDATLEELQQLIEELISENGLLNQGQLEGNACFN